MSETDYSKLIAELPKPETPEEQYLYALVCSVAQVPNVYGIMKKDPFKRMEKYWKLFYEVAGYKFKALETPSDDSVGTTAIKDSAITTEKVTDKAITLPKLADTITERLVPEDTRGAVTVDMLSDNISSRLLGDGRVSYTMLATDVTQKLLSEGSVDENMLATTVSSKLLGSGRVSYDMLDSYLKSKIDKIE